MRHREQRDAEADRTPLVGRPRGPLWRALQSDGVVWEGQVLLIGTEVDLAARVVVTEHRLAFARGGGLVLDVPRSWLQPAPVVRPDGTLLLSIRSDADAGGGTERVLLRMRDGHPATFHLLELLGGGAAPALRAAPPLPLADPQRRPSILPPLPEPARAAPDPSRRRAAGSDRTAPLPVSPLDPFGALPAGTPTPAASGAVLEPVVRPGPAPAAIGRDRDWNLQPIRELVPQARRRRRGWGIRLGGLLLLLAAAFVGISRIPSRPDDRALIDLPAATETSGTSGTGLPRPDAPMSAADQTALAVGVGGVQETAAAAASTNPPTATSPATEVPTATTAAPATATAPPNPTATRPPNPTATAPSRPTATVISTAGMTAAAIAPTTIAQARANATLAPSPSPTPPPTATTAAPTATPPPTATPSPTATPPPTATSPPTAMPSPVPTAVPVPSPTLPAPPPAAAASEPTTAPSAAATTPSTPISTATATATATAVAPGETPTTAATAASTRAAPPSGAAAPTQAPSVGVDQVPAQVVADGPLRFAVEVARRGAPLPEFRLPPTANEEWVALILRVRNTGDAVAELATDDLALRAAPSGQIVELYGGTGAVASQLGLDTPVGPGETIRFDPGQERRLAAVFRVPADAEGAALLIGDTALELAPALDAAAAGADDDPATETAAPALVEATVTRVVDGERIEVLVGDAPLRVRYLGVDAPIGDRCHAAESTTANAALVEGATVWLERQRSDADVMGTALRDVWIDDGEGGRTLVAARLAAEGAVRADPDGGNVRYAGWIAAAAAEAEADGAGLWGACPSTVVDGQAPAAAVARPFAFGR